MTADDTPALLAAQIACHEATDGAGLKVFLTRVKDPEHVRKTLMEMTRDYRRGVGWLHENGEEAFCRNLSLVSNLMAEWLKHKRTNS